MSKSDESEAISIKVGGKIRSFDIGDPKLPDWVEDEAFGSGGYPYKKKLDRDEYEETLRMLQIELVKVQGWLGDTGKRIITVFEGRDAAGKGGAINATRAYMNPRTARIVALPKPTEKERGQWYYQRYVDHFPTAGEFILFDRSWYNRAGVEPVMGFCTPEEHRHFLEETPNFERMPVNAGIYLFKFWLNIGREMQLKRFHDRRHDPLKIWKLSPMDIASLDKWDDYSAKRNLMLEQTHTPDAPWTVVRANDKRRARINVVRSILSELPYTGKDENVIGDLDGKIVGQGYSALMNWGHDSE